MRPSPTPSIPRRSRRPSDPARLEPIEPRLLLDSIPFGVADGDTFDDERTTVAVVRNNDFVTFTENDDDADRDWRRQNFDSWLPDDFVPISAVAFRDPKDDRIYDAVNAPTGLAVILDDDDDGIERVRFLTDELDDAQPITSRLTTFASTDGRIHLAGLTASGDLVLYRQTGSGSSANRFDWEFLNITADALAPRGLVTPAFRGDLASFVTPWNTLNIVGIDASGNLQTVWLPPPPDDNNGDDEAWNVTNLSAIAGTPALAGSPAALVTDWGGINIAAVDTAGDMIVTWWVPQFGGDWQTTNFSDAFGGPTLVPTPLASTTPWGGINIGAVSNTGDLTLFWWVPEFGPAWQVATDLVPGAEDFSLTGVTSFTSPAGTVNALGANPTGQVLRYSWRPGEAWRAENLDTLAEDENDDLDDFGGPFDPALQTLAGTWRVSGGAGGVLDELDDNDFDDFDFADFDDEDATVVLSADGTWILRSGDLDFDGLDSDATRGTWTRDGSTVTIIVPDIGRMTANDVPTGATNRFTTRGVTLNAAARNRLERAINDFDTRFPNADLRDEINLRGGLDAVLANINLVWTRI